MRTSYFQFGNVRSLLEPRKPRHPLVRLAVGLAGLAILAVLIFFSVFVGAAMILVGVTWKLLSRGTRREATPRRGVVDGEYRVVRKPALPLSR
ncbi:MAG TPA: hypothetical protein VD865_00445 [Stenotrophomonas sp.]|nr:hypothetical protein [Stenotrophomonas sp.]